MIYQYKSLREYSPLILNNKEKKEKEKNGFIE